MTHPAAGGFRWRFPTWQDAPDASRVACVGYDAWADELVIRLANAAGKVGIGEPSVTPDDPYANVLADAETGEVIGVQVDDLRDVALRHVPHWAPVAAADRLVADVHDPFTRYGVGGHTLVDGKLRRDAQLAPRPAEAGGGGSRPATIPPGRGDLTAPMRRIGTDRC
jgi:hypothetical protein